jgi:hypothetical protein
LNHSAFTQASKGEIVDAVVELRPGAAVDT